MAADDSTDSHTRTYYEILELPVSAQLSLQDIKSAYRQALLKAHPDKVSRNNSGGAEVDLIRKAWEVLSDNALRKEYDAKIKGSDTKKAFVSIDLDEMTFDEDSDAYNYPCRCGETGGFAITEEDLEKGRDIVECRGCSSWIRVLYETVSEP